MMDNDKEGGERWFDESEMNEWGAVVGKENEKAF